MTAVRRDFKPLGVKPLPLLGLAAGCVLALLATYVVLVRTQRGQRLDQAAFDGRALATPETQDAAQQLLTTISVGTLALATVVLVGQALVRRRLGLALVAGSVIAGAVLTTDLLKHVLDRPDLVLDGRRYENSFPSGHATVALAVGMAATLAAPSRLHRHVAVFAVAYGAAVGIAVIAAGWHRASDVAGAYFVVAAWAAVAALVDALLAARRRDDGGWPRPTVARGYIVLAAFLLVGGYIAALAVVIAGRAGNVDWTAVDGAFVGACAAVGALAALLMAALLTAVRAARRPARG